LKNPEVLEWLHNSGCPQGGAETMCAAARIGHLEVVQWLHNRGCPWKSGPPAVKSGLPAVTAALAALADVAELDAAADQDAAAELAAHVAFYVTCDAAAGGGHLEVLRWAREHGATWHEETCIAAARGGHLAVLQWLREHDCPWNSNVSYDAALGGHLEVLQWMRENDADERRGRVWDEFLVRAYADGPRKQEVLTWLDQLSGP
jgi:hypothetical protein